MRSVVSTVFYLSWMFLIPGCNPGKNIIGNIQKQPFFEVAELFSDERFPNVVVTTEGTVLAVWGNKNLSVRRSEDGGETWGPEISIAEPSFQGGGAIVDDISGDILFFGEDKHPPAPLTIYRSSDDGRSWTAEKPVIHPNSLHHIPSMHMNEHGITLKTGKYKGRLIRPSRYYGEGNDRQFWNTHYTNAIYSDDGGRTWQSSEPFPAFGTGEAAIAELNDGTLYYNSRRHKSTDGTSPRKRYIAFSSDGGQTWDNLSICDELPDGAQHTDYGLMGGLTKIPDKKLNILLFSNIDVPSDTKDEDVPFELRTSRRFNGTIWASIDGGESWSVKKVVEVGSFAYSSLATGIEGTPSEGFIYLFYESDGGGKIARFNLKWLLDNRVK